MGPRLRGDDGGGWNMVIDVIARSTCDEAIQLFLAVLDCFANARNDGDEGVSDGNDRSIHSTGG
jgi:hypothetical protein